MRRLFVAVWPSPEVMAGLMSLPRPPEQGVRWVPPEQWHVTLRFLGDADPDDALAALSGASLPAATAELGPRVSRLGRAVVVVPVAGLDPLADAVRDVTAAVGEPPDPRGFTGHLTLARLRHRGACRLTGTAVAERFVAHEVALVASEPSSTGPVYRVLGRFPVGAGEEPAGNA
jgi:RNA 2',3'-cyclic 3'-phosphodiesterase